MALLLRRLLLWLLLLDLLLPLALAPLPPGLALLPVVGPIALRGLFGFPRLSPALSLRCDVVQYLGCLLPRDLPPVVERVRMPLHGRL